MEINSEVNFGDGNEHSTGSNAGRVRYLPFCVSLPESKL
jgi:hypothetical protein